MMFREFNSIDLTNLKAIRYIRVSTPDQTSRESYKTQLTHSDTFVNNWKINLVGEYIDKGKKGWDRNRPEFKLMFEALKSVDCLIVQHTDRFIRDDIFETMMIYRKINNMGKIFISILEGIPDFNSLEQQLMLSISSFTNAKYIQDNRKKTKEGIRRAILEGKEIGRPQKILDYDKYLLIIEKFPNMAKKEIAKHLNMSYMTLYRRLKDIECV